jgi:hypothetical protein
MVSTMSSTASAEGGDRYKRRDRRTLRDKGRNGCGIATGRSKDACICCWHVDCMTPPMHNLQHARAEVVEHLRRNANHMTFFPNRHMGQQGTS